MTEFLGTRGGLRTANPWGESRAVHLVELLFNLLKLRQIEICDTNLLGHGGSSMDPFTLRSADVIKFVPAMYPPSRGHGSATITPIIRSGVFVFPL